jgi:tetratricopeptide (TPR) repeat protein
MTVGRVEEGVQQARSAVKVDPRTHEWLAFALLSAGRYDEAADQCQKFDLAEQDWFPLFQFLGRARLGQGRIEEAIRLLEQDIRSPNQGFLGYAYARAGRHAEAEKLAAENGRPQTQVLTYAGLGDKNRMLEALDRMAAISVWRVGEYLTYPELSLLRGDPRLKSFRKKIGLPE